MVSWNRVTITNLKMEDRFYSSNPFLDCLATSKEEKKDNVVVVALNLMQAG